MEKKKETEGQLSAHEQDLQRLAELRLMDDDFFSEVLDGKIEAVEYILSTILERKDLKVIKTEAQKEYKSAVKRSIRLDIQAIDDKGQVADIEIQRSDKGAGVRRARFHSGMIDRALLGKGDGFEGLVDTYVIFITEDDKFGMGIPMYHVERKITELNDALFGDGAHIIYVNGEFQDTSHPVGCLMHDFSCKDADDMLNPILAEEVRYFKETEGGRGQMCRLLEEMRNEVAEQVAAQVTEQVTEQVTARVTEQVTAQTTYDNAVKTALKLLAIGKLTQEEIADSTELSLALVQKLAENRPA